MIKENLSLYFRHFAVDATHKSDTCKVIFSASDSFADKEVTRIKGYDITALKQVNDLATLQVKDIITINNKEYKVAEIQVVNDGTFHRMYLNPVR